MGIDIIVSPQVDHDAELQDVIGVMSTIGYNGTKFLRLIFQSAYSEVLEQVQKAVSLLLSFLTAEAEGWRDTLLINGKARPNWRGQAINIGLRGWRSHHYSHSAWRISVML